MKNIFSEDISPYSFIGLVCDKALPSSREYRTGIVVNAMVTAIFFLGLLAVTSDIPQT